MFFFKKKKPSIEYKVYGKRISKLKAIINDLRDHKSNQNVLLFYFFDETLSDLEKLLNAVNVPFQVSSPNAILTNGIHLLNGHDFKGKSLPKVDEIIVLEVHPFKSINDTGSAARILARMESGSRPSKASKH